MQKLYKIIYQPSSAWHRIRESNNLDAMITREWAPWPGFNGYGRQPSEMPLNKRGNKKSTGKGICAFMLWN